MKSDLLSLVLPDDLVRKITHPCPFVIVNTSGRVDSLDSAKVELIAKGHKFYMELYSEIFQNFLLELMATNFSP